MLYQDHEAEFLLKVNQLSEPSPSDGKSIASPIGSYTEFFEDSFAMMEIIRRGVPYDLFHLIRSWVPFADAQWADLIGISVKSLHRYQKSQSTFSRLHSEKIIELAEVTHIGLAVFSDDLTFWRWMDTPSFALGNYKPIDLISDSYGKELIVTELIRIDHGILA